MLEPLPVLPERFLPAYRAIQQLEREDRYLGAFIFGSVAQGKATENSDLDVQVITSEDNPCTNINHPIIGGVKLDLTFFSLDQLKARTQREMEQRERMPMLAEIVIVFDKTDELVKLQAMAQQVTPKGITPEEYQFMHFMFYHGNDKVERNLERDPQTALLVMHVGLNDFLKYHYQLHQKWWVSSKWMLADLRNWDPALAQLMERFVAAVDVHTKFHFWSAIVDHILAPIGGRQPIAENSCDCIVCQRDLSMLQKG